jgi:hypothetical protein
MNVTFVDLLDVDRGEIVAVNPATIERIEPRGQERLNGGEVAVRSVVHFVGGARIEAAETVDEIKQLARRSSDGGNQ